MPEFLTSQEMRRLENAAIESGRVSGIDLMLRAGETVVDAIFETWSFENIGQYAVVFCGPGNNGGDGFVVAHLLSLRGWRVTVFFYGRSSKLPPDARAFYKKWLHTAAANTEGLSFPQVTFEDETRLDSILAERTPSIVVDALFGIGLSRPLTGLLPMLGKMRSLHEEPAAHPPCRFVAIDLPSGLAESGPLGAVFPADLTVTFHRKKAAHKIGQAYCGQIVVKDIGLEDTGFSV